MHNIKQNVYLLTLLGCLVIHAEPKENPIKVYESLADAVESLQQQDIAREHINHRKARELLTDLETTIFKHSPAQEESCKEVKEEHTSVTVPEQSPSAVDIVSSSLVPEPDMVAAYTSMADQLKEQQQYEAAAVYLKEALRIRPRSAMLMFDLANTLNMANYNDEALHLYYQLLHACPTHKAILYNVAYTLRKMGRIDDAMIFYDAAIEQDPEYPEANFSRGLAFISIGDYERGWAGYEYRFSRPGYPGRRKLDQPLWDGSDLHGGIIYLYAEQGLGDTFQFIRYARVAKQRGGRVVVSVQEPLVTILSLCPYIDRVISLRQQPAHFKVHAPLMSLPHILGTRVDTVPNEIPYLYARPDLVEAWKKKLAPDTNFRVGICFQGNPNYSTAALRSVVKAKSIPLAKMIRLFNIPNITFYCLQRQTGTDQLNTLPAVPNLIVFDDDFDKTNGRFMDTAAVIKNLDLMITVDTSMCHFAAGLGVPVWTMLPEPPDFRWLLNRTDTPWYPNMRLFKQPSHDDWDSVIEQIAQELEQYSKEILQKR